MTIARCLAPLMIVALLVGCAHKSPPLPPTPWRDTDDAIRILRERAHSIHTVSSSGLITLTRPSGESVRFDAAIVTAPPDRLRLRAWKLSRAIFDLTLTPDGLWLLGPDSDSMKAKVKSAGVGAGQIARNWSLLSGAFFDRQDLAVAVQSHDLVLTAPQNDMTLRCYVDRLTLVPTRYLMQDDHRKTRFSFTLDGYRLIDAIPYPTRLQADSDSGRVLVQLDDVELNTDLAPAAFIPPTRAEKLEP
jgi:outer membrane lipoprotein-sorting protein